MPIIDTLYTYKFIKLLSSAWTDTDAYNLGIIDDEGTPLKSIHDLRGPEEKKAYSSFVRLVFKLKRMLEKIPGGRSATFRYASALHLIREEVEETNMTIPFGSLEEALKKYLKEEVTNVTGGVDKPEKPLGGVHKRKHEDGAGVAVKPRKADKEPSDDTPDRKKTNEKIEDDEDEYDEEEYYDDEDYDEDDDWEYDPELDGPEDEWEEMSDEEYEAYKNESELSYQVIGGVVIRSLNEGRKLTVRIRNGKRVKKMETRRKGFTRTGHRKMRGAKLARKRRSLKKAVRKSHRSGAMRKRGRSLRKRRNIH